MFPDEHWVYYCVDALQEWSGLDQDTLRQMEREWIPLCDEIVAVSEDLAAKIRTLGPRCEPRVVTHGVDFERWSHPGRASSERTGSGKALFFGAIDERIDVETCALISESVGLVAIGPTDRAPKALLRCPGFEALGPRSYSDLPSIASAAQVLVLPYRTDASTRSLSPLKLKEYLATDRPIVVANLPAVSAWPSALDIAANPEDFARLVGERALAPTPREQLVARSALRDERWEDKAQDIEASFREPELDGATVILHVRSCGGPGSGPEKTLLRCHRYLDPSKYRVVVALLCDPDDRDVDAVFEEARSLGADFVRVDDRGPFDRGVLRMLVGIVTRESVSIWHGHDAKSNLLGVLARRRVDMKLVGTAHGWVHRTARTPIYDRLDRWALRRFDAVISVSRDTVDALGKLASKGARIEVIENGVEVAPSAQPWQSRQSKELVLGAVGRLEPEKGLEDLLKATALLRDRGEDVRLRLFGVGSLGSTLRALAGTLVSEGIVEFVGFEQDRDAIYRSLDMFILPSLREGTPNSLLEAMAHGRPIVATPVGGVPQLVRDEVEALLVTPSDPEALASGVSRLSHDSQLAARLAETAFKAARKDHGFDARMERVSRVYDEVMGSTQA
jgi:glycosyltransferase involved in cell wall biosynthesis